MANEFVARKGLIALSNSEVTGSLGISGDLTVGDLAVTGLSTFGDSLVFTGNIDRPSGTSVRYISSDGSTLDLGTNVPSGGTFTWRVAGNGRLALNNTGLTVTGDMTVAGDPTFNLGGSGARALFIDGAGSLPSLDGATVAAFQNNDATGRQVNITLVAGNAGLAQINFADAEDEDRGAFGYDHAADDFSWKVAGSADKMVLSSSALTLSGHSLTIDTIELNHASANTLTASSGVLSIEGNRIFHAGGTDIPVADGGTGVSSLTDKAVLISQDSGTDAVGAVALTTSGQLIIGGSSGPTAGLITADDGLVVTTGDGTIELDLDLKANGGLVIESNKLALDLGASSTTGTLSVPAGGTGVATLTDGGILLGNGTGAIVSMAVLADGAMVVGDGTLDPVVEIGATLRTSIGVGTGDSPQFTGVNVGAASDTTVTRASAGDIAVEGNIVYRAGGTDVAVADGGTGQSNLNNLITMGTHTTGDYVASLVAGTGVTLSNNSGETATPTVAIGQAVATTSTVTFNTGSFTGDLTIVGNLIVQGATTQLETTQLTVEDALITVAKGSTNSAAATGAGIEIDMGGQTNPSMAWDHAAQEFDFNYPINSSQITGSFSGDGAGITNIVSTLNLVAADSSTAAVALKTQNLTITGGTGIDTTATGQIVTITGEAATTDNAGVVELADVTETNAGSLATVAVTPAGLAAWTGDASLVTVGTITAGTWQGTTVAVDQGGTGATTLNNLITMGTHTTGNYVATVTAGTGLTSTGATSGESIAHSLSVDTSQTQIVAVGALDAGSISSNFGTIDIGSSTLTAGSATVAGTNISGSSVSVATGGSETTSVIALVAVASYSSAQFDYTVNDGTNYRAGTVIAIWKAGASITFTDYSTPDIGNTSDATFTMDESGGNARLKFTSSAGTWTVKIAIRAL